jgi:hypothetical protein
MNYKTTKDQFEAAGKAELSAILSAAGLATACIDEDDQTPAIKARPMKNEAGL